MSAIFTCLEGRIFQIEPAFIVEKCVEKVVEKEVIKEVVKEVEVVKEPKDAEIKIKVTVEEQC
ncbi:hypothetical protein GGH14_005176 [Coemansia sp. RSA 370]|nr:hypothetical protein GGH14_005176 [Coemansia sp. RSA 370]